jgi:hypothetical protein
MPPSEGIRSTQRFANAAEAFVSALTALFPGETFAQLFHGDTIRRAYWIALQEALDSYANTPPTLRIAEHMMTGEVLADPLVVTELLKLFVPDQRPNYPAVAARWGDLLALGEPADLTRELQTFFELLANQLRRSPEVRLALEQLAETTLTSQPDLNRQLDTALAAGPGMIARQIKHLLMLAVNDGLELSPLDRLEALIQLADMLPAQTIQDLWDSLPAGDSRLRLAAQLAPHLTQVGLVPDPLFPIQRLIEREGPFDPAQRVEALLSLAPYLATSNALPALSQRVLDGAQAIEDAASRVRALSALIEKLPPMLQPEAVQSAFDAAACCIGSEEARAIALIDLAPHLPPEFHPRLLTVAYELETPESRALLLGRILPYLTNSLQLQALIGAFGAIQQIPRDDARVRALIAMAPSIDSIGQLSRTPETLEQALEVIFSITRPDARARALAALAPALAPELLSEALHTIQSISDEIDRAAALERLAPHLPEQLGVVALTVARELILAEARASALSVLAPYLSDSAHAQALSDALAAAMAIQWRYDRIMALIDLAPHLPDDLQERAMREALNAARSIPDAGERGRVLISLAPHVTPSLLPNALADVYTILDPAVRVPVLCAFAPCLPDEPRLRVIEDVIKTAKQTGSADLLAAIAPVLPPSMAHEMIELAQNLESPYERLHIFTALIVYQPDELAAAALETARSIPDDERRVSALHDLAPHLPPALRPVVLDEALSIALNIPDPYERASALAGFAPYVQGNLHDRLQDAFSLALSACFEANDPRLLARLAVEWARLLTPGQSYALWRQAVTALRKLPYAQALAHLAALAPVLDQLGASGASAEVAEMLQG